MRRDDLVDLNAFQMIAEERSFTRAAAKLATSQSALSHMIRRLEARLGVRLLTRTTRSVAPTEAGERLLATLGPAFDSIEAQLAALAELREKPAGTIRITTSQHAADMVLWPVLRKFLSDYPDIHAELSLDSSFADIVSDRFDAGVRLGEAIAQDMIAMRIGPDLRMAVVGSPGYFAQRRIPRTPQDLADHRCINLRMPTSGGLYAWELQKGRRGVRVRVEGQLVFNSTAMVTRAAEAGFGLGFVMEDQVAEQLGDGRLVRVLDDWCPLFSGYHLYYPSRRQPSAAFALLVGALRYRGETRRT
jgi:DNA-binding transcriptional LysR family regulator